MLATYDGARPLAGGQTLVNVMKARAAAPDVLVDLADLDELRTIGFSSDGMLEIGAMVTCTQLMGSSEVEVARPILAEVASTIADVQVRNRGTIGGNVCVSDPTNHFPVLLVALDATFTIRGQDGERTVPADEFFLGVYMTAVGEGELLTRIDVPAVERRGRRLRGRHDRRARHVHRQRRGDASPGTLHASRSGVSPPLPCARPRWRSGCRRRLLRGRGARGRRRARRVARPAVGRPRLGRLPSSSRGGLGRAGRAAGGGTEEVVSAPVTSRTVSVEVNGEQIELEVPTRRLLVHFIRDDLGLTGTHIGCDTGNCGACTVHVNGEAVKSCMMLAVQAEGTKIATVEGLAADGELDGAPAGVQRAPRAPVRLLHARDADERDRAARAEPAPVRGGGARGDPGEHLPLHGLREHRRGRGRGRREGMTTTVTEPGEDAREGLRRAVDPAQGGPAARPGSGHVLRRRAPARDGLRPLRPLAVRAREDHLDRRLEGARARRASTGPSRATRSRSTPIRSSRCPSSRAGTSRTTRSRSVACGTWASRSPRSARRRASSRATRPS